MPFLGTPESSQSTLPPLEVFQLSLPPRLHSREVCPVIGLLKAVALVFGFTLALVFREEPKVSKRTEHYWAGGLVGEREPEASSSVSFRESPSAEAALSQLGREPGISAVVPDRDTGSREEGDGEKAPLS